MVDAYASDYLEQLGLSNSKSVLKQRIMTFSYDCRGPARILAQEMTEAQAITSCETLNLKEDDFHQTVNTGYQPVADDHSDSVDVIVFKTKSDYSTYSSFLLITQPTTADSSLSETHQNKEMYLDSSLIKTDGTTTFRF